MNNGQQWGRDQKGAITFENVLFQCVKKHAYPGGSFAILRPPERPNGLRAVCNEDAGHHQLITGPYVCMFCLMRVCRRAFHDACAMHDALDDARRDDDDDDRRGGACDGSVQQRLHSWQALVRRRRGR